MLLSSEMFLSFYFFGVMVFWLFHIDFVMDFEVDWDIVVIVLYWTLFEKEKPSDTRQHVNDCCVIYVTHVGSFDHQKWPYRKAFERSQHPLYDGVTRVSKALMVWCRMSFFSFSPRIVLPMQNFITTPSISFFLHI